MHGIRVMFFTPGRLRVRFARLKHNEALAHSVAQDLSSLPGIDRVQTNPRTGSILLEYQHAALQPNLQSTQVRARVRDIVRRHVGEDALATLDAYLARL